MVSSIDSAGDHRDMDELGGMTSEFVGRIAVAVWIGRLSDEAARAALEAYAAACQRSRPQRDACLENAVLDEYRHRREGQDLCS
jgi:hypothetical protein